MLLQGELFVCQSGEERCAPRHAFGPAQRDHYLIHFVLSGEGVFYCGRESWPVRAGQGFLILPEEVTFYQADAKQPWHYAWVGYQGQQAGFLTREAGLDAQHRVFTAAAPSSAWETLAALRQDVQTLRLGQQAAAGDLLRFLALIAPSQGAEDAVDQGRAYVSKALWYLSGRYDRPISIQETAAFVGLSRSHLYRLMEAACGCSPKEALLRIRMFHAARLLTTTALTLEEIAPRVGLQNGAQLGAAFRGLYGVTPGAYRRLPPAQRQLPNSPPSL